MKRSLTEIIHFRKHNPVTPIIRAVYSFLGLLCIGAMACCFFTNKLTFSMAADVVNSGTDGVVMRTEPEKTLFTIGNMVPGEQRNAFLTAYNEGQLDFSYNMTASLYNGSEELFEVLDLKVTGNDGKQIYLGKLKDLNKITLGDLSYGKNELLCFTIGFPAECGNEYQNLNAIINFLINATECPKLLTVVWEPPLDKADVDSRKGGIMPLRFHLLNNNVYDTDKRGVDLVLKGVNAFDQPVEYIFKVTDGTLLWQAGQHPQYELPLLDTEKYPVKPDSYYTATVKYGEMVLGTTQFKSGK